MLVSFPDSFHPDMTLLEVVGGLACLYLGLMKFVPWLMRLTKAPLDVTKLGQWAVVTGATDGIGEIVYLLVHG